MFGQPTSGKGFDLGQMLGIMSKAVFLNNVGQRQSL
jgi:hypothetical protein